MYDVNSLSQWSDDAVFPSLANQDCITLKGVQALGIHGVLPAEKQTPQPFIVDVEIFASLREAGTSDDLTQTVDYGQVANIIKQTIEKESFNLIEKLGETIAERILSIEAVSEISLTVHKPQAPIEATFSDVSITIHREKTITNKEIEEVIVAEGARETETAILSVGGNQGDMIQTLRQAVVSLDGLLGTQVTGISPVVITDAVGGVEQPQFHNIVVQVETTLNPTELLNAALLIEQAHGRVRDIRWGPRTLDIDIIKYGDMIVQEPDLVVPHPRAHERAFVLKPWSLLDPHAALPGSHGGSVTLLAARAEKTQPIHEIYDDWFLAPQ